MFIALSLDVYDPIPMLSSLCFKEVTYVEDKDTRKPKAVRLFRHFLFWCTQIFLAGSEPGPM